MDLNFADILYNEPFLSAIIAWCVSQILKTIIYAIINKEIDFSRLVGDGGLPSAHSATVCGLCGACAFEYGLGSFQFAVTAVLAMIVMHDAMGVRRESGKHAVILNEIIEYMGDAFDPEVALKEMLGHTPTQVVAGGFVGIVTAAVLYITIF